MLELNLLFKMRRVVLTRLLGAVPPGLPPKSRMAGGSLSGGKVARSLPWGKAAQSLPWLSLPSKECKGICGSHLVRSA